MTPYSSVYSFFYQKVNDYTFLNMTTPDFNNLMQGYLHSAATKFKKCLRDLTQYDDTQQQFNITLTDQEKEVLATLMVVEYLTPKIVTMELLKQGFSNRDWNMTSQANHLKQILDSRNAFKEESDTLILRYTYDNGDIGGLQ